MLYNWPTDTRNILLPGKIYCNKELQFCSAENFSDQHYTKSGLFRKLSLHTTALNMINMCYVFYTKTETVTLCHDYLGQEIAHVKQIGVAKLTAAFSMLKSTGLYSLSPNSLQSIWAHPAEQQTSPNSKTYDHSHYYWAAEIYLCSFTAHIQEKVFLTYRAQIIHWSQVHIGNFVSFLLQGSKVRYKDAKLQARKYLWKQVHIWY